MEWSIVIEPRIRQPGDLPAFRISGPSYLHCALTAMSQGYDADECLFVYVPWLWAFDSETQH